MAMLYPRIYLIAIDKNAKLLNLHAHDMISTSRELNMASKVAQPVTIVEGLTDASSVRSK